MQIIKSSMKYNKWIVLTLFVFWSGIMVALHVPRKPLLTQQQRELQKKRMVAWARKKIAKKIADQSSSLQPNEWFIYAEGTSAGIVVPQEVLELTTFKKMLQDLEGQKGPIPIPGYAINTIQDAFDILKMSLNNNGLQLIEEKIKNYSLDQLVGIVNCIDYLGCSKDIQNIFVRRIREDIEKSDQKIANNAEFQQLHPDLKRMLMLAPSVSCLKNLIINRDVYEKDRKQNLYGGYPILSVAVSPDRNKLVAGACGNFWENLMIWERGKIGIKKQSPNVYFVAFSADSKKIVSCGQEDPSNHHNIYVWDVLTKNLITSFAGPDRVSSAVFSSDGDNIVLACTGKQDNLKIVNASTGNQVLSLIGHPEDVYSVNFSCDGTKIVSGCRGTQDNIILWDVSNVDWNNPKEEDIQKIVVANDLLVRVFSVALSPDGTKIISGSKDGKLVLWNVSNKNDITYQMLAERSKPIQSVIFNHDGTKILVGLRDTQSNIELWDISDSTNITHQVLTGIANDIYSVAFGFNTNTIVVGGRVPTGFFNSTSLIYWTLLTNKEVALLDGLKNYSVEQMQLIYQLCLESMWGVAMTLQKDSPEYDIFISLPEDMQKLLSEVLLTKSTGWFASWWK